MPPPRHWRANNDHLSKPTVTFDRCLLLETGKGNRQILGGYTLHRGTITTELSLTAKRFIKARYRQLSAFLDWLKIKAYFWKPAVKNCVRTYTILRRLAFRNTFTTPYTTTRSVRQALLMVVVYEEMKTFSHIYSTPLQTLICPSKKSEVHKVCNAVKVRARCRNFNVSFTTLR
eukprot:1860-Heterococcus_DN1.PRE.6